MGEAKAMRAGSTGRRDKNEDVSDLIRKVREGSVGPEEAAEKIEGMGRSCSGYARRFILAVGDLLFEK